MTDLDIYQAAAVEQYQARLAMTPDQAKALDEQVRQCTQAVLREGTDYGVIPGTGGQKTLWRPGAQKLLQWFGLGISCERVEVERDDAGRKHGITYRATVTRRRPDGTLDVLATCEGTADYDEDKFYQSAEDRQRKAEDAERRFAREDKRPPRPTKWQGLPEYRAPWNALMKRAQKRAIVGAVVDATAAGGIFSEREEDDRSPAPADDGPSWYEQAIGQALAFTDVEDGRALYVEAAQAHRDGQCSRRQMDHVQNTITQRVKLLQAATPVDVEDLGRQAAQASPPETGGSGPEPSPPAGGGQMGPEPSPGDDGTPPEDRPGSVSPAQLTKLHTVLTGFGFTNDDRERKLHIAETVAGRELSGGPHPGRTSKNLTLNEARKIIDTLDGFGGDYEQLADWMAERERDGDPE
jgi:hypothetical protein